MPCDDLLAEARKVRERAYAPFSRFRVGAAARSADGRIFSACNVESSSYGLSICAERAAVAKAVSEGCRKLVEIAIVADTERPCPPCGACRQLIYELGPDARVVMANLQGDVKVAQIADLLPGAFTAEYMRREPERDEEA